MANDNEYEKHIPIIDTLFYAAKCSISDYMSEAFPPESEEMRLTWAQLSNTLDKFGLDTKGYEDLTDAIIEYGQAVEWHFFVNGIRFAGQLMSELQSLSLI